jgi:hypothetical protein
MQHLYVPSWLRRTQPKQATCMRPELLKTDSPTSVLHARHICVSRLFPAPF